MSHNNEVSHSMLSQIIRSALGVAAACIAGIGGGWALSKVMGWDFDLMSSLSFVLVLAIIWLIVVAWRRVHSSNG
jgi:hypothetical protein